MRRRNVVSFEEAHEKEAHEKAGRDWRDGLHAVISAHAEALPMAIPTSTMYTPHPHAGLLLRRIMDCRKKKCEMRILEQ